MKTEKITSVRQACLFWGWTTLGKQIKQRLLDAYHTKDRMALATWMDYTNRVATAHRHLSEIIEEYND